METVWKKKLGKKPESQREKNKRYWSTWPQNKTQLTDSEKSIRRVVNQMGKNAIALLWIIEKLGYVRRSKFPEIVKMTEGTVAFNLEKLKKSNLIQELEDGNIIRFREGSHGRPFNRKAKS